MCKRLSAVCAEKVAVCMCVIGAGRRGAVRVTSAVRFGRGKNTRFLERCVARTGLVRTWIMT